MHLVCIILKLLYKAYAKSKQLVYTFVLYRDENAPKAYSPVFIVIAVDPLLFDAQLSRSILPDFGNKRFPRIIYYTLI